MDRRVSHLRTAEPRKQSLKSTNKDIHISRIIHSGMTELFHEGICTDFEIVVGGKVFKCHKVVLAAVSDYFKAMFQSGMQETVQQKATFDDLNPKVFEYIFELLYPLHENRDILKGVSEGEVSELLRVSDMLQMNVLLEKCCAYFKQTMSPSNCIERWKMAKSIMNKEITDYAWQFLLRSFQEVLMEDTMVSLDFDEFVSIIEDDNLIADSEYNVWQAIKRWIAFDEANRTDYLEDLLRGCSLTELGGDALIEEIAFDPMVRRSDAAAKLVRRSIQYKRHPAERNIMEVKLRNSMEKEQVIVFLGQKKQDESTLKKLKLNKASVQTIILSTKQQKMITVRPLDDVKDTLAFCALDMRLYVTSGKRFVKYEPISDSWKELKELPFPLRDHTMVATDENIYVIGGSSGFSDNSQVLRYNLENVSWDIVGELLASVRHASSVSTRHKIYIFGGTLANDDAVDSVQEYDIEKNTCTILCHLPKPTSYSRAERRDNDVYIVTCDGDVVHISLDTTTIDIIASIPDFDRYNYGIDIQSGTLSVYGGLRVGCGSDSEEDIQANEYIGTILNIDITKRKMLPPKKFQFPVEVFGCARVVLATKSISA